MEKYIFIGDIENELEKGNITLDDIIFLDYCHRKHNSNGLLTIKERVKRKEIKSKINTFNLVIC